MKIAVISAARTRSTVLATYRSQRHPELPKYRKHWYGEYYSLRHETKLTFEEATNQLFTHEDFFIKILGQNLSIEQGPPRYVGLENIRPERLRLKEYDHIYLIERYDFFHQMCSYVVAHSTRIWNEEKRVAHRYKEINSKKFDITLNRAGYIAADIVGYLEIKKHLENNQIPYVLYDSEKSITNEMSESSRVAASNLDYENIIVDYNILKPKFNEIFYKHFNYQTCYHDYPAFMQEAEQVLSEAKSK